MRNFKFSLNALVALCCLVFFTTSCQDDTVENDLSPLAEAKTDPTVEMQTMLEEAMRQAPTDELAEQARHKKKDKDDKYDADPLLYHLSVTTSAFDPHRGVGEVLTTTSGTLRLEPTDEIPGLHLTKKQQKKYQLYRGGFTFVRENGETESRQAFVIAPRKGHGPGLLFIPNVPHTGDLYVRHFKVAKDFEVRHIINVNQNHELVSVDVDADFKH